MAMHWTVECDAADPQALASFWAFALGYVKEPGFDEPDSASIIDPEGRGPAIAFLQVPEEKTAKNRMRSTSEWPVKVPGTWRSESS